MPLKFLRDLDKNRIARDIVVIGGLPYYRSSGTSLNKIKLPGEWLPIYGTLEEDTYASDIVFPKNRAKNPRGKIILSRNLEDKDVGWFIKVGKEDCLADIPELKSVPITDRIYSKEDLITSLKLSLGDGRKVLDDKTLRVLGLNSSEIKETKTPLILEASPDKITSPTSRPEEINDWLVSQGSETYIPLRLRKIGQKLLNHTKEDDSNKLKKFISSLPQPILKAKGNSSLLIAASLELLKQTKKGDPNELKKLITLLPQHILKAAINTKDEKGSSPLLVAASLGRVDLISILKEAGGAVLHEASVLNRRQKK